LRDVFHTVFMQRVSSFVILYECVLCMMEKVSILCLQVSIRMTVSLVFTLIYLYCFLFVTAHWHLIEDVLYRERFNLSWYSERCLHTISEWIIIKVYIGTRARAPSFGGRTCSKCYYFLLNIILCTTDSCRVEKDLRIFFKTLSQAF